MSDIEPHVGRVCRLFQSLASTSVDRTTSTLRAGGIGATQPRNKGRCGARAGWAASGLSTGRMTRPIKFLRPTGRSGLPYPATQTHDAHSTGPAGPINTSVTHCSLVRENLDSRKRQESGFKFPLPNSSGMFTSGRRKPLLAIASQTKPSSTRY